MSGASIPGSRAVTDDEGLTWTCVQAFAGLGNEAAKARAARLGAESGTVPVVCTPSGGERSVRIELPVGWERDVPDEALLRAVRAGLDEGDS